MTKRLKDLALRAWLPIVALAPLLSLVIARRITATDGLSVWIAGYELHGVCWVQERFGASCPFCGITRSVIFTVHGELSRAAQLNPGGVLLVFGIALVCVACMFLSFAQSTLHNLDAANAATTMQRTHNRVACFFAFYAALTTAVIIGGWVWRLASV